MIIILLIKGENNQNNDLKLWTWQHVVFTTRMDPLKFKKEKEREKKNTASPLNVQKGKI